MVIPLGGMNEPEHQETPEAIREHHTCWWYLLFVLLIATSIGCLVALKIFDALITLFIGIWAYYLAKDRCKEMSQSCLFSFGFMCVIQAVFEFIILLMSLPGRRTQSTTAQPAQQGPHGSGSHSSSYTVTTKITPFLSEAEGWHYNFQSYMMIISPVVFLIGALMSKSAYGEYETSLFDDQDEGRGFGGGNGMQRGGGGGGYYGGGGPPARPANPQRFGGGGGNVHTFGGQGQRLGS